MDLAQLRGKTVSAEVRLWRRMHVRAFRTIRVHDLGSSKPPSICLMLPELYNRPGHEFMAVSLNEEHFKRLRPVEGQEHDFVYDGVLYLNDDESEDTRAWTRAPKSVR